MFEFVFLIGVTIFVFMRLHAVLGQRTGHEKNRQSPFDVRADEAVTTKEKIAVLAADRVQRVRKKPAVAIPDDHPCVEALKKLQQTDKTFEYHKFLEGAQVAFSMIFEAFQEGHKDTLKKMVSKPLLMVFEKSMKSRDVKNADHMTRILGFDSVKIQDVSFQKFSVTLTVRYETQQKTFLGAMDAHDTESRTENVVDIWSFQKDTRSRNPNWTLVGTQTEVH